ncbi:MAG TPA: DedA family protein [Mucilaginibacter sp.]|jgi:membrane protein DedA with SNARE-associated domain
MSSELSHYITHYGYIAIFTLIFIQEIGIPNPIPNELVLLFAGYLTVKKALSLPLVLITAITADLAGAILLYFTFYYFGSFILNHKPKWLPVSTAKINKLSSEISTGGLWTIFLGRITPLIRGYVSVISGLIQIKPKQYLPIVLVTAIMVCCSYVIAGHLLGPYWTIALLQIVKVKYGLLGVAGLVLIIFVIRHFRRMSKTNSQ